MKKILVLFICLLVLVGCSAKKVNDGMEEQPVDVPVADVQTPVDSEEIENPTGDDAVEIVGGFTNAEDGTITDELLAMFNKATEGLTGVGYTPKQLLATQVVAGMNYKFLCDATTVTAEPVTTEKIVVVYKDLNDNVSILSIEDVVVDDAVVSE